MSGVTAITMARFGTVQPVTYLSECCHAGCKAPVQFLSINPHFVLPLCGEHGLAQAKAEAGGPVVFAGPLGFISAEDPTEA